MTTMRARLAPLLLGLALGSGAAWLGLRLVAPGSAAPAAPAPDAASGVPVWDWRSRPAPPALTAAGQIRSLLDAWQNLRGPDGSPADHATRAQTLRALISRLPANALARLLDRLVAASAPADRALCQLAFDHWTETDAPAATRWAAERAASSEPADRALLELARQALRVWAKQDVASAAAWVFAMGEGNVSDRLAPQALAALAEADPAAALQAHGARAWGGGVGIVNLAAPLRAWALRDPAAALGWIAAQPATQPRLYEQLLAFLSHTHQEGRRLAEALVRQPGIPRRAEAIAEMIRRHEMDRPAEAITWLESLADADLRRRVLAHLATRHDAYHPEKSLPFALALPAGQERTQALARTLDVWHRTAPEVAKHWIQTSDDPSVAVATAPIHAALLADIARDEPATALAEWEKLASPVAREAAIVPIVEAWSASDPGGALRWYVERSRGTSPNLMPPATLLFPWAQKDPEAALRWTEDFVAGTPSFLTKEWRDVIRDRSFDALGGGLHAEAPRAETAALLAKIRDPRLRAEVLEHHAREWLTKDPAAARAWLENSDALSPEQVAALLQPKSE